MFNEDSEKYINFRKKRVKRIKRSIVIILCFFVALPNFLCLFLFGQLNKINDSLDNVSNELSEYKNKESEEVDIVSVLSDIYEEKPKTKVVYKTISDKEAYPDKQRIYLTFDDGPSNYTDEILDILNEYNVKASFFVLAKENNDDKYLRILNEGHTLGIHSYSHVYNDIYSDSDSFAKDVESVYNFISDVTDNKPLFYRFPGGSSNTVFKGDKRELFEILSRYDLTYYDWNVASNDSTYGGLNKYQIAQNVINSVAGKEDAVILLHDANDKHSSVEALSIIIETLQSKEDVIFLPITENSEIIQHISFESEGN